MNGGINRCGALTFDMTTGAIREADPEYEALLAAAAQGSKGNLFSLVAPREQRRVLHSLREQGEKAGALREEFPVQMADGSMGWQLLYGRRNPADANLWDCIAFDCTSQVETEQELQRLREQMQLWVDNTPGGVVSYLYNGWFQVDFISEGMLRIIGCTREEFQLRYGDQLNRVIHPQDYERVTREVVEDSNPGKPKKVEYRILDYRGQVKWLFGNRQVIHDMDGNTRVYLVVVDVTDLHRANEDLLRASNRMESLVDSVPGGVARILMDEKLTVVMANKGFYTLTGYTREEWDKPPLSGDARSLVHPDDLPGLLAQMEKSLRSGDYTQAEYRVLRKDGTSIWIWVKGKVVELQDGIPVVQAVFVDNTAGHNTIQRLAYLNRQQAAMFNAIPGGVVQFSLGKGQTVGEITVNDSFLNMVGLTREEYQADNTKARERAIYPADREWVLDTLRKGWEAGEEAQAEFRLQRPDGEILWVLLHAAPLSDDQNRQVYQCVFVDITKQKQTQAQLEYEKLRYQTILDCTNDVVFEYDMEKDTMVFYDKSVVGQKVRKFTIRIEQYRQKLGEGELVDPKYIDKVLPVLEGQSYLPQEIRIGRPDAAPGEYFWFEMRGTTIPRWDGKGQIAIGVLRDINAQKNETMLLKIKSERDSLTQLYNKAATSANIAEFLHKEGKNAVSALLIIDLDNFKEVNDTYGHQFGDAVLSNVGKRLRQLFRSTDVIGRVGGDEFVVFMKDVIDLGVAQEKAAAICNLFHTALAGEEKVQVSSSVGIAYYPKDGDSYDKLFQKADRAMYLAKSTGKNQFCLAGEVQGEAIQPLPGREPTPADLPSLGSLIPEVVDLLFQGQDWEETVQQALALAGSTANVSRVYFCLLDGQRVKNTCLEWCAPHVPPARELREDPSTIALQEIGGCFDPQDNILCFFDMEEIQGEYPHIYRDAQKYGIRTMLQSAIIDGGLRGFVGFDDCRAPRLWTKSEVDFLSVLGKILYLYSQRFH